MEHLLQWLFFSDREISFFQFIFREYLNDNIDNFTPSEAYELALVGTNTQFQMRILKSRIQGERLTEDEIESNDTWVILLLRFNGLVEYVKNKFIEKFNSYDDIERYEYLNNTIYSYFNRSPEQSVIDPNSIKLIKKILKP